MRTTFDIQEKLASHFGFWRVLGMGIEMRIKKREKREENKEKNDGSSKPNYTPPSTRAACRGRPQRDDLDDTKKGWNRMS